MVATEIKEVVIALLVVLVTNVGEWDMLQETALIILTQELENVMIVDGAVMPLNIVLIGKKMHTAALLVGLQGAEMVISK